MSQISKGYLVVSRIVDKQSVKGYLVIDKYGARKKVRLEDLKEFSEGKTYLNAEYNEEKNELEGLHGININQYPCITDNYVVVGKDQKCASRAKKLVILASVKDPETDEYVGLVAFDAIGNRYNLTKDEVREMASNPDKSLIKFINQELFLNLIGIFKKSDRELVISLPKIEMPEEKNFVGVEHKKMSSLPYKLKPKKSPFKLAEEKNSESSKKDSELFKKAESILKEAEIKLEKLSPFFGKICSNIKKEPSDFMEGIAANEKTIFYNVNFIQSFTPSQVCFILLHETINILMQNTLRFFGKKNYDLWNVATDIYINALICKEFGLKVGEVSSIDDLIEIPPYGIFIETIGENLDFTVDTPEAIYLKLEKENPEYHSLPVQITLPEVEEEIEEKENLDFGHEFGTLKDALPAVNAKDGIKEVNLLYNKKEVKGQVLQDIVCIPYENETYSQTIVPFNKIYENILINSENFFKELYIDHHYIPKMNDEVPIHSNKSTVDTDFYKNLFGIRETDNISWISKLNSAINSLKREGKKNNSTPQKKLTLQHSVDVTPQQTTTLIKKINAPSNENTPLESIKICIDTSGSLSEEDIRYILSEVYRKFVNLKIEIDVELIYWSDKIEEVGNLDDLIYSFKIGSNSDKKDVRCVFDYLSGKTDSKLSNIKKIFIFSDGSLKQNYEDFKTPFESKVIWIISRDKRFFTSPFGGVCELR